MLCAMMPCWYKSSVVVYIILSSVLKHCCTCLEQAIFNDPRSLHSHMACWKCKYLLWLAFLSYSWRNSESMYCSDAHSGFTSKMEQFVLAYGRASCSAQDGKKIYVMMNFQSTLWGVEFIESFDLEGSFKSHPVHLPCSEQKQLQLDRIAQSLL